MPKKKTPSNKILIHIITMIVLVGWAYYIGQHLWQTKTTIEEAKQDILDQSLSTSSEQNISPVIVDEDITTTTEVQEKISIEQSNSFDISDFPVGIDYGNPQRIGTGSISYSDIRSLEITQTQLPESLSCESVTEYLEENTNGFYWWNTCREIQKDSGISLFFLGLDDETYTYKKMYFLPQQWLVWVYEMETGETWELSDKLEFLKEKNAELKATHEQYAILEIVDNLFIEILQK